MLVTYCPKTQTGTMRHGDKIQHFERTISSDEYQSRLKYIKALGGTDAEARDYAGFLDYPRPSIAAKMMNDCCNLSHDWLTDISNAVQRAAGCW